MIHYKSLIESLCNVGSGFIISLLVWEYLISFLFNIEKDLTEGLQVTMIFTVISIVRGYIWRRVFDRRFK
jgi:hypothetical protein